MTIKQKILIGGGQSRQIGPTSKEAGGQGRRGRRDEEKRSGGYAAMISHPTMKQPSVRSSLCSFKIVYCRDPARYRANGGLISDSSHLTGDSEKNQDTMPRSSEVHRSSMHYAKVVQHDGITWNHSRQSARQKRARYPARKTGFSKDIVRLNGVNVQQSEKIEASMSVISTNKCNKYKRHAARSVMIMKGCA